MVLAQKFQELKGVRPQQIGIDRLFTLNDSSRLVDLFDEQEKVPPQGDIGGSKEQPKLFQSVLEPEKVDLAKSKEGSKSVLLPI